jgi:hypothetical protein
MEQNYEEYVVGEGIGSFSIIFPLLSFSCSITRLIRELFDSSNAVLGMAFTPPP